MGKNRRFVGFFTFLSTVLFSLNLWAAGYTCPTYTTFTSCGSGRYMVSSASSLIYDGTPKAENACAACPTAASGCPGGTAAPRYKVTLSANGGTAGALTVAYRAANVTNGLVTTETGTTLASFTNALPTNPGYYFTGYYTTASGGTQIVKADGSYNTTNYSSFAKTASETTLYAQWTQCPEGSYCDGVVATSCPNGGDSEAGSDAITDCFVTVTYKDTLLGNKDKIQNCQYNGSAYVCDLYGLADLGWSQSKNSIYYSMLGWGATDGAASNAYALGAQGVTLTASKT